MKNSYSIIFHPKAEKEYLESVEWYENALTGLGQEFVDEIGKIIHQIYTTPLLFPQKKLHFREAPSRKFPFIIVFELKPKQQIIQILSIYHTSRNPKKKYK